MENISLVSSTGDSRPVQKEVAMQSPTLKRMLESSFIESQGIIRLEEFDTKILDNVIEYLEYKFKYQEADDDVEVPEFKVSPEISLDLLLAADYLGI